MYARTRDERSRSVIEEREKDRKRERDERRRSDMSSPPLRNQVREPITDNQEEEKNQGTG